MSNPKFSIEELNVLTKVADEISHAKDESAINKIYRQARNWSRYHCYYAEACSPSTCRELNRKFALYKNLAVQAL